jgi:hypothetical protein
MQHKGLYKLFSWLARKAQVLSLKKNRFGHLLPPLNRWSKYHEITPFDRNTFRQRWKELAEGKKGLENE